MYRNISAKIFSRSFCVATVFLLFFITVSVSKANAQTEISKTDRTNGVACVDTPNSPSCKRYFETLPDKGASILEQTRKEREERAIKTESSNGPGSSCFSIRGFSLTNCLTDLAGAFFGMILSWVNLFLGTILAVASFCFDFAVYFTILEFKSNFAELKLNPTGNLVQSANIGSFIFGSDSGLIYYLWGMIRDFLNILVFLLVIYSAVRSMLDGFENTKKRFISLLVFSIVVNFSLLFVKLAIDVSNILALQAYTLVVQPTDTSTFLRFSDSGQGVKSFGQFISQSVDLQELYKKQTGENIATAEIKSLQNSFMFQLGKMIMLLGLIYVLFYMTGLLIARAVNFVFAMILAPLIVADEYFALVKGGEAVERIRNKIRTFSSKTKGNFYEGLVKGPVLIFFVFLIGVFAEAIISNSLINSLSGSIGQVSGMKNMDSSFTKAILVFFKYTIFMFFCFKLFEMLNENIKFEGGSGFLDKWGSGLGQRALGRTIGGLARTGSFLGQRVVAQGFADGRLGKALDRTFSNFATKYNNPIINSVGRTGSNALEKLRGSTYDFRNAKSLSKDSTLGGLIKNATNVDISKVLGKGIEGSYEERNAKALKEAEDRRKQYITDAQKGVSLTPADEKKIEDESKVDFGSQKLNAKEIASAIAAAATTAPGQEVKFETSAGTKTISVADRDILFKVDDKTGLTPADLAQREAANIAKKKKQDKVAEKKKEVEDAIKLRIANRQGPTFMSETLSPDGIIKPKVLGRDTDSDIAEGATKDMATNAQARIKDTLQKTYILDETKKTLTDTKKQLEFLAESGILSENELDRVVEKMNKIDELIKVVDIPKGTSDLAKIGRYNKFKNGDDLKSGEEQRKEILDVNKDASEFLTKYFDNQQNRLDVESKKYDMEELVKRTSDPIMKKIRTRELNRLNEIIRDWKSDSKDAKDLSEKNDKLKEKFSNHFGEKKPEPTEKK